MNKVRTPLLNTIFYGLLIAIGAFVVGTVFITAVVNRNEKAEKRAALQSASAQAQAAQAEYEAELTIAQIARMKELCEQYRYHYFEAKKADLVVEALALKEDWKSKSDRLEHMGDARKHWHEAGEAESGLRKYRPEYVRSECHIDVVEYDAALQ